MSLKDSLFFEYPVPKAFSIWNEAREDIHEDLSGLIEFALSECQPYFKKVAYTQTTGMNTVMPEDCVGILSVKYNINLQGNKYVKFSYNRSNRVCNVIYTPATIAYLQKMTLTDVDNLTGDELMFFKSYCLWKMAEKELNILSFINYDVDHATFNLDVLKAFKDKMETLTGDYMKTLSFARVAY